MKARYTAIGFVASLLLASFARNDSYARQNHEQGAATGSTKTAGTVQARPVEKPDRDISIRKPRRTGPFMSSVRRRKPGDPEWKPGPVPETIPVHVRGRARDEKGNPVPRARIFLFLSGVLEPKIVGHSTADASGNYVIEGDRLSVVSEFPKGHPLRPEITPHADFVVCGTAPGLGLAWSPYQSMYALTVPHPDDIQGRLPLGRPVELDLTFPAAAALSGTIRDEDGKPVAGAKLQIFGADLLDDSGHETGNSLNNAWKTLPGSIGFAVTNGDGRFAMDRLPDRACFMMSVTRPETDNTHMSLFAATIAGPDTFHAEPPAGAFNGRMGHPVKAGEIAIRFPRIRRLAISVIGDDTNKGIPDVRVGTLGETLQSGITSYGTTDRQGNLILGLPPGQYRGIFADPLIDTNYIRTYERPLVVKPGEGDQPYLFVLNSGCELRIEALEAGTSKPVAGAFFWKIPVDKPDQLENIRVSTFRSGEPWTNGSGMMRAVLAPEPGKRYRFRFAGIHEPNMPESINPESAKTQGYSADPAQSEPVELTAGKTVLLRFVLSHSGPPGSKP